MSIRKIFEEELSQLKTELVEMCRLTEQMIENAITAGKAEGMISMDSYLLKLYNEGKISTETLINYADHPEHMTRHLHR